MVVYLLTKRSLSVVNLLCLFIRLFSEPVLLLVIEFSLSTDSVKKIKYNIVFYLSTLFRPKKKTIDNVFFSP